MFAARGVPVIDADELAREVQAPGQPAHADIAAAWPEVVGADGRRRPQAAGRHRLRRPDGAASGWRRSCTRASRTLSRARGRPRCADAGHRLALYEASLLVESGRDASFDGLIVVTASPATQIARVVARDGAARGRRPRAHARAAAPGGQGAPRDARHRQRRRPGRDRSAGRAHPRELRA